MTALQTLSSGKKTEELSVFVKLGVFKWISTEAQLLTSCSVTNNEMVTVNCPAGNSEELYLFISLKQLLG